MADRNGLLFCWRSNSKVKSHIQPHPHAEFIKRQRQANPKCHGADFQSAPRRIAEQQITAHSHQQKNSIIQMVNMVSAQGRCQAGVSSYFLNIRFHPATILRRKVKIGGQTKRGPEDMPPLRGLILLGDGFLQRCRADGAHKR